MRKRIKYLAAAAVFFIASCSAEKSDAKFDITGSMPLSYAECFTVDYCSDGNTLITVGGTDKYILVPENGKAPDAAGADYTVIQQPVSDIYIAASSALDLFCTLGSLDTVRAVSIKAEEWSLPDVAEKMENEEILYAGKYSAPDYELILSEGCTLAVESTMITHKPEVKELLEAQGIPVLVERSSYESHPLGRMEWIKLYGLLLGRSEQAEKFFNEKISIVDNISDYEKSGKTAAFFYINTAGGAVVRKPGDYISKMINIAGGEYILSAEALKVDDNALSTMNMQFETFYSFARDADYLIYDSTIDGSISSIEQLIGKNSLLSDFRAVKSGNVWCTDKNVFQKPTASADMISEMNRIFGGEQENMDYFYRLS